MTNFLDTRDFQIPQNEIEAGIYELFLPIGKTKALTVEQGGTNAAKNSPVVAQERDTEGQ